MCYEIMCHIEEIHCDGRIKIFGIDGFRLERDEKRFNVFWQEKQIDGGYDENTCRIHENNVFAQKNLVKYEALHLILPCSEMIHFTNWNASWDKNMLLEAKIHNMKVKFSVTETLEIKAIVLL